MEPILTERIFPTQDRIIIERFKPEIKTASGIILTADYTQQTKVDETQTVQEDQSDPTIYAKVLRAGPDCKCAKEGDTILVGQYSGSPIYKGDFNLRMIKECDILAYISDFDIPKKNITNGSSL